MIPIKYAALGIWGGILGSLRGGRNGGGGTGGDGELEVVVKRFG